MFEAWVGGRFAGVFLEFGDVLFCGGCGGGLALADLGIHDGGRRGMAPGRFGGGIKLFEAGGSLLGRVTMKKHQLALASSNTAGKR
jgi:hypothetical protein